MHYYDDRQNPRKTHKTRNAIIRQNERAEIDKESSSCPGVVSLPSTSTSYQVSSRTVRNKDPKSMEEQHKHNMKNIYMIRHGVALHNVMHDKVDHADPSLFDSHLIPEGQKQAELMGQSFFQKKEHPVDLIVSSPLTRCLQTAECFARAGNFYKCSLPSTAVCHEGLREIFGIHQADRRRKKSELQVRGKITCFQQYLILR